MKFKLFFLLFFLFSCSAGTSQKSLIKPYTSKGFALIYNENDYSNINNMTGSTFDVEKSLNTGNHDDDDDESQEGDNLLTTINILRNKKVLYILPLGAAGD